jgi:hypothetical protein
MIWVIHISGEGAFQPLKGFINQENQGSEVEECHVF